MHDERLVHEVGSFGLLVKVTGADFDREIVCQVEAEIAEYSPLLPVRAVCRQPPGRVDATRCIQVGPVGVGQRGEEFWCLRAISPVLAFFFVECAEYPTIPVTGLCQAELLREAVVVLVLRIKPDRVLIIRQRRVVGQVTRIRVDADWPGTEVVVLCACE